jgi:D-3-phosphoglycerate dehydrogenase
MKITLIDHFPEDMLQKLRALGQPMAYHPEWSAADVYAKLADTEILVLNSKVNVDAKLLQAAPKLKMACRAGVGMDHFDLPLLEEKGILAVNTPGANAVPVAEQAVGMLLSMLHNVCRANQQVRQMQWLREQNRGTELMGKTVGIIGFGNTGGALGRMLAGFNCKVLAYDKYKSGFGGGHVQECSLEQIWAEADILSLHIPLTEETDGWVNADFFSRFAKPIWFLNLSRGPIVPLAGLIAAMQAGNVVAAGLDVLENEKLGTLTATQKSSLEQLFADERVLFTPHIGGWSHESLQRINDQIVLEIANFLKREA